MNSRRRVTAALLALLALVIGVWLGQQVLSEPPSGDRPGLVDVQR